MKALRVRELPAGNWLYEMKFDGYLPLAFKAGAEFQLLSRNRTNFSDNYPRLIDALKLLRPKTALVRRRAHRSLLSVQATQKNAEKVDACALMLDREHYDRFDHGFSFQVQTPMILARKNRLI